MTRLTESTHVLRCNGSDARAFAEVPERGDSDDDAFTAGGLVTTFVLRYNSHLLSSEGGILMPTSLNGWPVIEADSGLLSTGTVPATKIRVTAHQVVLPLVLAMLYDYAAWVRPLRAGSTGGYAFRQARTGAGWSVHSAGAAWDINWTNEGAQKPSNRAFWNTVDNHRAVDQIKQVYNLLEWGGDWSPKFWDPMHWQISAHAKESDVARQVEFLGIDENGVRHNGWKGHKLPEPRG